MSNLYEADSYMVRQKVLKLLGEEFHIYSDDSMQQLIGYSKQKALKLKEDIRVYSDEQKSTELICIKARSIIDFGAGYDITDSQTGEAICSFKREGLKSLFKDSWKVMDSSGNQIGTLGEDSGILALVRRFVPFASLLIPQEFVLSTGTGSIVFTQKMNPLIHKMFVTNIQSSGLDPRIVLAATMLLIAIEGRQGSG
ncbi:MAG: hypothetical protein MKZ68_06425 [Candidatus Thalassarchaeum sp.]|nr:hypothetical protein [Candidatus Thalassarchaeum sp.]|tara:strand:- start:157 stop:747 length:591 start_codon:yes stop_codon:yes gene_type:complete